jgi:hypothetical protein
MSLYTRARKHIDMDRVKELHEEKKRREDIIRQQQLIIAEIKSIDEKLKCVDWRRELEEGMTTSGMGMLNLEPGGDVDLVDLGNETPNTSIQPGATNSGGTYTFGPVADGYGFASTLSFFPDKFDLTKVDTLVFDFTAGDITNFDFVVDTPGNTSVYSLSISSGRKVITLKQSDRTKNAILSWTVDKNEGEAVGTNRISGVALQRRTPMNVLVPLDDPEAIAFMRGGLGGDEERRAKLKDMLDAGNELMIELGLDPSQTSPGDIALDTIPYEPPSPGPGGYKPPGSYDPSKFFDVPTNYGPQFPSPNLPDTGPGRSSVPDGTTVAWEPGEPWPNKDKSPLDGPQGPDPNRPWVPEAPKAKKGKKQRTMVAHHEPKYSNWRRDLNEMMTTSGMGMLNLEPGGDVDLENVTKTATPGTDGSGGSGGSYSFGNYDGTGNAGFVFRLDTRKYDTLKFSASSGNATKIELSINGGSFSTLSSGTNLINLSSANRGSNTLFTFNAEKSGGSGSSGASISGTVFQRRSPINLFVSLDDPEANAFIRMGDMNKLSAEERKKKLKDMLEAGNKYLSKYTNITPSKTTPGDIELASADWPKGDPSKSPPPVYKPGGGGWPNVPGVPQPYQGQPGQKYPLA